MKRIGIPVLLLLLLAGNGVAQEKAGKKITAPLYEYLKPRAEADNADFNQVYYQTTIKGVSVIASISAEANYLVVHYFFKNNVDRKSIVKLDQIRLSHLGKALTLYEGRFVPKAENDPAAGVTLALNELKGECSMEMGEYCTGDVYASMPKEFSSGAVVLLSLPMDSEILEREFIYEKDWMTGQTYRQLRDAARQKESK